jgi:probable phosphoglycerate mutase
MEQTMRLILIRHGEAYASLQQIIADVDKCPGLTEHGYRQAKQLAARLRATGEFSNCTTFVSSPVPRARQTAENLLDALPVNRFDVDYDLRDVIPGEAEGLTQEEHAAKYGRFSMVAEPERPFSPGGESWLMFKQRVQQTMQRFATRYAGQTVVAVAHSGFIVGSILELFAIPRPGGSGWLHPSYTGLTEWQFSDNRWCLARYNDTSHLIPEA